MSGFLTGKKSGIAKAQKRAAYMSINMADAFHNLGAIPQMKGTEEAIDLARRNIGNYQPDLDEARRLSGLGALGITDEQIEKYTNPYLQDVLDFSIQDMEEAAARRREERRGIASRSGADFATPGALNRYQIEDALADRELTRSIGGLSANVRREGFDNATRLSENERLRQAQGGSQYSGLANQTNALGNADVNSLVGVGELEAIPYINEREHLANSQQMYGKGVADAAPSVAEYQKGSILSQIVGTVGAVKSMFTSDKMGANTYGQAKQGGGQVTQGGGIPSIGNAYGNNSKGVYGGGFNSLSSGLGSTSIPLGSAATGGFNAMSSGLGASQIPLGGIGAAGTAGAGAAAAGGSSGILSGIMGFFSDQRLKRNIRRIGTYKGMGLYKWTYLWGQDSVGVMAREVRKVMPEAVHRFFGYDRVDYLMVTGA